MELDRVGIVSLAEELRITLTTKIITRTQISWDNGANRFLCSTILLVGDTAGNIHIIKLEAHHNLTSAPRVIELPLGDTELYEVVESWATTSPPFASDWCHVAYIKEDEQDIVVPTTHPMVRDQLIRLESGLLQIARQTSIPPTKLLYAAARRLSRLLEEDRDTLIDFFRLAASIALAPKQN